MWLLENMIHMFVLGWKQSILVGIRQAYLNEEEYGPPLLIKGLVPGLSLMLWGQLLQKKPNYFQDLFDLIFNSICTNFLKWHSLTSVTSQNTKFRGAWAFPARTPALAYEWLPSLQYPCFNRTNCLNQLRQKSTRRYKLCFQNHNNIPHQDKMLLFIVNQKTNQKHKKMKCYK